MLSHYIGDEHDEITCLENLSDEFLGKVKIWSKLKWLIMRMSEAVELNDKPL